jgi:hypothetical protein
VIPIILISACIRFACARSAAQASYTEAFVPSSNPAYGAPSSAPPPSYQASVPPPAYQGGGVRQDWR